jgi:hypothetical protein
MPTPQKFIPKNPRESEEDKDEKNTLLLSELAAILAKAPMSSNEPNLDQQREDFNKIIKRSLHQKKDEILYDALARSQSINRKTAILLKEAIEEAAEITQIERVEGGKVEISAFVIPIFFHSMGGLDPTRSFQDQEAFELISKSFQEQLLESAAATVVLVSHAYHLNEADSITYSHLHEMLRDAYSAMTNKRHTAAPAIERSFAGWPDNPFAPNDKAIELRFLLGFVLKEIDDPFYVVPTEEEAADAYFAMRESRFQNWAVIATPLVRRCFGLDSASSGTAGTDDSDVHFLYQDLFHGGKERGIAEYFTLQMISELSQGLQSNATFASQVHAVLRPVEIHGESSLKVQLYAADNSLLVSADRPIPGIVDWDIEFADAQSALAMIGIEDITIV